MPNPKVGTVTMDVTTAVKNAKAGQVQYRTDKGGIVHATVGRASFSVEALQQNVAALIDALGQGQAGCFQGRVSEENCRVVHDGRRRAWNPLPQAVSSKNFGPDGFGVKASHPDRQRPQVRPGASLVA
jgi:hypothetical protein